MTLHLAPVTAAGRAMHALAVPYPRLRADSLRPYVGILGVLLGSIIATLASRVTTFGLSDLRGGLHAGFDEGAWITTVVGIGQLMAGVASPYLGAIFGVRRVLLPADVPYQPAWPAVGAIGAWQLGRDVAVVLEEVQMTPGEFGEVVGLAGRAADRAGKQAAAVGGDLQSNSCGCLPVSKRWLTSRHGGVTPSPKANTVFASILVPLISIRGSVPACS